MGYAVVATDYAGLGSNVPHQYLVGASQANDVINGLKAARAAIPELGPKWVAVGHSQGARAVIEVALLENDIRDSGYLGAISLAPGGGDPSAFLDALQQTPYRGYLAFVAFGAKATFPEFAYEEILTPAAVAHMPAAETSGWMGTMATFAWEVAPGQMLKEGWRASDAFSRYTAMSLNIDSPVYQPILLLAGGADTTAPPQTVAAAFNQLKAVGADVVFRTYPGLDHDPLVFGSFRDQLRWVEDRFGGKATQGDQASNPG
jgi:pimeloyl-ACP methyl ester carboxylesterase